MHSNNYDRVLEYFRKNRKVTAPAIQYNLGIGFADTVAILHALEGEGRIDYIGGIHYVYRKRSETEGGERLSSDSLRKLKSEADQRRLDLLRRVKRERRPTPFLPFDDSGRKQGDFMDLLNISKDEDDKEKRTEELEANLKNMLADFDSFAAFCGPKKYPTENLIFGATPPDDDPDDDPDDNPFGDLFEDLPDDPTDDE